MTRKCRCSTNGTDHCFGDAGRQRIKIRYDLSPRQRNALSQYRLCPPGRVTPVSLRRQPAAPLVRWGQPRKPLTYTDLRTIILVLTLNIGLLLSSPGDSTLLDKVLGGAKLSSANE